MKDSEALEMIGAKHRDRLLTAYTTMSGNGASPAEVNRVLTDMIMQSTRAADVDGAALARRQLEDLGIEVSSNYFTPRTSRELRNEATRKAARDRKRLQMAVSTILTGDPEEVLMRLGRLALAEAIESARNTTATYMRGSKKVRGWVRELDSDPCELCRWWWRDGRVWPENHDMPVHKGCACAQKWVRKSEASITVVSRKGEKASAERRAAGTLEQRREMDVSDYSSRSVRVRRDQ